MAAIPITRKRKRNRVYKSYLPSAQLADVVASVAVRSDLETVCARAGIPSRVFTRWRLGEGGGRVDLGLADTVLTRLGLFWWDVWTEETVREPLFLVTTYVNQNKKGRYGHRRCRVKGRTIPYGDLGTDFWRLREIRALMSGESEEAA